MADAKKRHLSPTQLNMLACCGEQYRRRYMEGERIPPGVAMLQGSAMHEAAAVNFRQKKSSRKDLRVEEMVEMADATFIERIRNDGLWLTEEEQSRGQDVVVEEGRGRARVFAECHAEYQAPEYQPELVEEKYIIPLPGDYDLMGILDLADEEKRVVDFKTASRKKNPDEADKSVQLTTYAAIYKHKTGDFASEILLDVAVQTAAGNTCRQVQRTNRAFGDFQALVNRIKSAARIIKAGAFMPAEAGWYGCNPKWCGYHRSCPFVRGGQKRQGD